MHRIRPRLNAFRIPPRVPQYTYQPVRNHPQTRAYQQLPFGRGSGPQYKRFSAQSSSLFSLLFR
jgi:hypothetical protein